MTSNNYTRITTATTTVIGPSAATFALPTTGRRINLYAINIVGTTTGTVSVNAGATPIALFPVGTNTGSYLATTNGVEVQDLQVVTSAADQVVVLWNNF